MVGDDTVVGSRQSSDDDGGREDVFFFASFALCLGPCEPANKTSGEKLTENNTQTTDTLDLKTLTNDAEGIFVEGYL